MLHHYTPNLIAMGKQFLCVILFRPVAHILQVALKLLQGRLKPKMVHDITPHIELDLEVRKRDLLLGAVMFAHEWNACERVPHKVRFVAWQHERRVQPDRVECANDDIVRERKLVGKPESNVAAMVCEIEVRVAGYRDQWV
jgi:hypothetical protein